MLALAVSVLLSAAPAAEFINDVKPLFDVVTCQNTPPAQLDAKTLAAYCAGQQKRYEHFKGQWAVKAHTFFSGQLPPPATLPREVVYPFGGGDLMAALALFPEANVITTLSLELAGDPRRLLGIKDPKVLKTSLSAIANASASTLMSNDSLSKNLSATQQGELPGQLSMHLMGLALADQEPVSVRYFRVEPDGSLHYFTADEVKELEGTTAANLKSNWKAPDFSPAFANVEVQFVPRGKPDAPRRIHRHLAANLANDQLPPGVLKHLEAKGQVIAMTKAASYLLWREAFTTIRNYLLGHSLYMVSDSTGIPPSHWREKGCSLKTYGTFEKSFLGTWEGYQDELRKAFTTAQKLPMRFGYPDGSPGKHNHALIASCAKPSP